MRILTWHIHSSYLYYLTQVPHTFLLPVKEGWPTGYGGRRGNFPWGDNVVDVPAEAVRDQEFDYILFQSRQNWETDQYEILSEAQRRLPRLYLEHDPPRESPTETRHPVDDPDVLLVQVTHFNDLMWDNGRTPTRVIEHGVILPPGAAYTGELARGIVVVNGLHQRARAVVPLYLVGMQSEVVVGLGDVPHDTLTAFSGRYRFFFNPIRYTSLGLAVCEAMLLGLPVIGLATTEMATVIENGVSGYVDTNVDALIGHMQRLIAQPDEARHLGTGARRAAETRFGIGRFIADWQAAFNTATG